jgi:pimeloyl-ACP methyl ester carboxylesterase
MKKLAAGASWALFAILPLVALIAAFVAAARLTASLTIMSAAALGCAALVACGAARWALRRRAQPWRLAAMLSAGHLALVVFVAWRFLVRMPTETPPMAPRSLSFETWDLPTGSRVAVARLPGPGSEGSVPVVYLHGGPGGFVSEGEIEGLLRPLANAGFDVVAYDQAGGGESPPIALGDYSIARAVADLEGLREHLAAPVISLVGASWGTVLAYEYAATHPDRVHRMALIAPGPMQRDHQDFVLDHTAAADQPEPSFPLRLMAAMMLYRLQPGALEAFATRSELEAEAAQLFPRLAARGVCRGDTPLSIAANGGVDAYQFLAMKTELDRRSAPSPAPVSPPPTLVVRGACDFVPWDAVLDLRNRLSATVLVIPGIGHVRTPTASTQIEPLVIAHLRGSPLVVAAYTKDTDPAETAEAPNPPNLDAHGSR